MSCFGLALNDGDAENSEGSKRASSTAEWRRRVGRVRCISIPRAKEVDRDDASSSLSSSTSQSARRRRRSHARGVRLRSRSRGLWVPLNDRGGHKCVQDLAHPLGTSFAVLVQVLFGKNITGDKIQFDNLSMICTSAVEQSITIMYGHKFDSFLRSFDKSFRSTFKTFGLINELSVDKQKHAASNLFDCEGRQNTPELTNPGLVANMKDFQEVMPLNYASYQIILHRDNNRHLANAYSSSSGIGPTQYFLSTYERSVREQTRANDLKEYQIKMAREELHLREAQLNISSFANCIEMQKLVLGKSNYEFKKENLRNQMQETGYAQLLQQCMDLLFAGLIIMCVLLFYGAYIYSYKRITDATFACDSAVAESGVSWWMPKSVQTFNSGFTKLRCHAVALTRMSFGILMILSAAYAFFQRSGTSAPRMPVTFIGLLLGVLCGFCGKLCIDTLGGNGYLWLMIWEAKCMVHFFIHVCPSAFHRTLHGPVIVSAGANSAMLPFRIRRYMFYTLLFLILPASGGLLPFASFSEWAMHFSGILGAEVPA